MMREKFDSSQIKAYILKHTDRQIITIIIIIVIIIIILSAQHQCVVRVCVVLTLTRGHR